MFESLISTGMAAKTIWDRTELFPGIDGYFFWVFTLLVAPVIVIAVMILVTVVWENRRDLWWLK